MISYHFIWFDIESKTRRFFILFDSLRVAVETSESVDYVFIQKSAFGSIYIFIITIKKAHIRELPVVSKSHPVKNHSLITLVSILLQ